MICPNEAEGPSDIDYMHSFLFVLATGLLFIITMLTVIRQKSVSRGGVTCSLLQRTSEERVSRSLAEGRVSDKNGHAGEQLAIQYICVPGNFLGAVDLLLSPADSDYNQYK